MTDQPWDRPEPEHVVRAVDQYAGKMHRDAATASNVSLLDESQVYSLHLLAAEVYGFGYRDGRKSAEARHDGERVRRLDADREAQSALREAEQAVTTARGRLDLARDALVRIGYFTESEVGDDVAPRIIEVTNDVIGPLLTMVATLMSDDPEDPLMADVGVNPHLANMIHRTRDALRRDALEGLG